MMFGFTFALSPLYRVVCKVTGLNGGINVAETTENPLLQFTNSQPIYLQFLALNNNNLNWEFKVKTNRLVVHPGTINRIIFTAKNNSAHQMTVQAVPSFSPPRAAKYFHKIECFCFTEQVLNPGEQKEMPVVFRIDHAFPKEINTLTLAYTLFDKTQLQVQT